MSEETYQPPDLLLLGEEHVQRYQETDGEVGYMWNGVPTLLLTTTGRKSGESRTTPLIFGRDGSDYLVVASMGGAPQHPNWYRNLLAEPSARIQVRGDHLDVTAHGRQTKTTKPRLWKHRDRGVAELRRVPIPDRSGDPRRRALAHRPSVSANA